MGFFGWFFFLIFASWMVLYLFGKQITRFLLQSLINRVAKESQQQSKQYQRNYSQDPYHERITLDDELEVKIPRNGMEQKKGPAIEEVAEDVEFEEVRE